MTAYYALGQQNITNLELRVRPGWYFYGNRDDSALALTEPENFTLRRDPQIIQVKWCFVADDPHPKAYAPFGHGARGAIFIRLSNYTNGTTVEIRDSHFMDNSAHYSGGKL